MKANTFAKELNDFTDEEIARDNELSAWGTSEKNLLDFPNEVLVNIFYFVAHPHCNKSSIPLTRDYLSSRDEGDYRRTISIQEDHPKFEWIEKSKSEYSVKNLFSLRKVCKTFEDIINNAMMPGTDYQPILVDLKFKATESLNAVEMFKYGGTGAMYPCTRLKNITKFNSDDDYEHLQKFEKIRNLTFDGIPLTHQVFQTILRMDLKLAKKVEFLAIPRVELDQNVVDYMKNVMNTIDAPNAKFFFNSSEFEPNLVLFGMEPPVPAPRPLVQRNPNLDDLEMDENDLELQAALEADVHAQRVLTDEEEIRVFERNIAETGNKHHKAARKLRRPRGDTRDFRTHRTINILSEIILGTPHKHDSNHPYNTDEGRKYWKKKLYEAYEKRISRRSRELKDVGKWHLGKVFVLMEHLPVKKMELIFHLKMLKKIFGRDAIPVADENSMIARTDEMKHRNGLMTKFSFLQKLGGRSRLYTTRHHN